MDIHIEQLEHCDVVRTSGRIDSNTAPDLRKAFEGIISEGRHKIVFDMSEIDYISSSGVWVLLDTQKECKRRNRGELVIANVNENIQYTLELAGLKHFIRIHDDVQSAVQTFEE
jgi:anti-sigma B factor antagonist